MKKIIITILTLALWTGSLTVYADTSQAVVQAAPASAVTEEAVIIPHKNYKIPGILTIPAVIKEGDKLPAVLMLHGGGSDKNGPGEAYKSLAKELALKGIASLRIDFAGHGDSEQYVSAFNETSRTDDANAAIDYLISRNFVESSAVGVLGYDLGGNAAQSLAGTSGKVHALALWATTTENDTMLAIRNYSNPLICIHGLSDETVKPEISSWILEAAGSQDAVLYYIKNADHSFKNPNNEESRIHDLVTLTADWFFSKL